MRFSQIHWIKLNNVSTFLLTIPTILHNLLEFVGSYSDMDRIGRIYLSFLCFRTWLRFFMLPCLIFLWILFTINWTWCFNQASKIVFLLIFWLSCIIGETKWPWCFPFAWRSQIRIQRYVIYRLSVVCFSEDYS